MSKIKKLYAYIDIGCMNTISQSIQIRIIKPLQNKIMPK